VTEQARHIAIICIGAGVAVFGACTKTCEHELYALAGIIVAGEFGLARSTPSGPTVSRIDHPVTINQQERREQP
jgi:hypothetical protein